MEDVQIQKAITETDGLNCVYLIFYTNDPEQLLDAMQEAIKSTVREHANDDSYSNVVNLVIALTPVIKLNQELLEEQLNSMLPFFNEQFVELDAGPKSGEPFKFVYALEEDKPVSF